MVGLFFSGSLKLKIPHKLHYIAFLNIKLKCPDSCTKGPGAAIPTCTPQTKSCIILIFHQNTEIFSQQVHSLVISPAKNKMRTSFCTGLHFGSQLFRHLMDFYDLNT